MYQSFEMRGVPKDAAAHLVGATVGNVDLPIHAEIRVYDATGSFVVDLGKSGSTCWSGADEGKDRDRVRRYLAAKAGGPGSPVTDELVHRGARLILTEEIKDVMIDFVKITDS
jgi:hypothetical protein